MRAHLPILQIQPADPLTYNLTGAGPLLIAIPGLDGTGELFYKQQPLLARSYRVAALRLREGAKFTYDDLARDVAQVIIEQGGERAVILGESFGGTVALWFALEYPKLVERLVIVNSFPRFRGRLRMQLARLL